MSRKNALRKLLDVSLDRGTNKKLFASLLTQFLAQEPTADSCLGEILLEVPDTTGKAIGAARKYREKLQIEYAIEYALASTESVSRFFSVLPQLTSRSQEIYLSYLKGQLAIIKGKHIFDSFLKELTSYTSSLHDQIFQCADAHFSTIKHLWYRVVFFWGALVENDSSLLSDSNYSDFFTALGRASKKLNDGRLMSFVSFKFFRTNYTTRSSQAEDTLSIKNEFPFSTTSLKPAPAHLNGRKITGSSMLNKFSWLNYHFRQWIMGTNTTQAFIAYFGLKDLDQLPLAKELTSCFLTGYAVAVNSNEKAYVVFNWKNFILTQLPHDLKAFGPHGSISQSDFGEAIVTTVAPLSRSLVKGEADGDKNIDLGREFLQGCVYHGLTSQDQIVSVLSKDSQQVPIQLAETAENLDETHSLEAEFKSKVENANTEFVSFEESKIIEFFQRLPSPAFIYSKKKQQKVATLLNDLIAKLIRDKNSEKLSWLILTLSNVPRAANYIFYQSENGPWSFLSRVILYVDGDNFNIDEDDGNFSDTYACFGIMLTGVISVATMFGVEFSSFTIKSSYTIDYLSEFYFQSCDTLTNTVIPGDDTEKQMIHNYEALFKEWANALFDINNDGLSDELLKSINVKQIYKFIFVLFQQAITTRATGSMSSISFNNGIDYLSQNFLAPCSLAIMKWLLSRIGPQNRWNEMMIDLLLQIVNVNVTNGQTSEPSGPNYTFRMMLNAISHDVYHELNSLKGKNLQEKVSELSLVLSKETDTEYCQLSTAKQHRNSSGCMSESLRIAISGYHKMGSPTSIDDVSQAWSVLARLCPKIPTEVIHAFLTHEAELSASNRGTSANEESLFYIDTVISILVSSSCFNAEDASYFLNLSAGDKQPEDSFVPQTKFEATIDDHISSIFSDSAFMSTSADPSNEDSIRSTDHVMGDTDMDDLFDDMSGNFFNESMIEPSAAQDDMDIYSLYTQSARFISPLQTVLQMNRSVSSNSATKLVQSKLENELRKWKNAHEF